MGNRKTKEVPIGLSRDDLTDLKKQTGFAEDKILQYYASFLADCPSGKLSKKQFQNMYRQLYPYSRSDKFCNRIFAIFDQNKDNKLDFFEFLRAIKITMNGDIRDKLKCAFEIYDLNGDGKIDKKEMKKVLNHIYDMLGEDTLKYRRHGKITDKKVDLIFEKFDLDRDDCLSLDEFIEGCLKDEYLSQLLRSSLNMGPATATGLSVSVDQIPTKINSNSSTLSSSSTTTAIITSTKSTISSSSTTSSASPSQSLSSSSSHYGSMSSPPLPHQRHHHHHHIPIIISSSGLNDHTTFKVKKAAPKSILVSRNFSSNYALNDAANINNDYAMDDDREEVGETPHLRHVIFRRNTTKNSFGGSNASTNSSSSTMKSTASSAGHPPQHQHHLISKLKSTNSNSNSNHDIHSMRQLGPPSMQTSVSSTSIDEDTSSLGHGRPSSADSNKHFMNDYSSEPYLIAPKLTIKL